ncbi:hypothetical protein [Paenibacillus sp.]|uniref:hypothetical protein n=1 Tax=Paenibacillus sp. TaxID=58172 RepID=UPI002D4C766B|nr:hypothetical protein [Paenibacillus sp.]HZG83566.1 hypothetical protein [Paenibacillus sp.]
MLTFEQKLAVFASFPELTRKDVSLGRVNFQYDRSAYDKKNVGYHLHPNGNGFVYAGRVPGAATDDKGFVNIRDYGEAELRELIAASIRSLSPEDETETEPEAEASAEAPEAPGQTWKDDQGRTLRLALEDDHWFVYADDLVDSAFETIEEAEQYLREEGFFPA